MLSGIEDLLKIRTLLEELRVDYNMEFYGDTTQGMYIPSIDLYVTDTRNDGKLVIGTERDGDFDLVESLEPVLRAVRESNKENKKFFEVYNPERTLEDIIEKMKDAYFKNKMVKVELSDGKAKLTYSNSTESYFIFS